MTLTLTSENICKNMIKIHKTANTKEKENYTKNFTSYFWDKKWQKIY